MVWRLPVFAGDFPVLVACQTQKRAHTGRQSTTSMGLQMHFTNTLIRRSHFYWLFSIGSLFLMVSTLKILHMGGRRAATELLKAIC